jgi:hypothetical protein
LQLYPSGKTLIKIHLRKQNGSHIIRTALFINLIQYEVKYSRINPQTEISGNSQYEMNYLGTGDFVEIDFKNSGKLTFSERYNNNMNVLFVVGGKWRWNVDSKRQLLKFRTNKKVFWTFKFISEKTVHLKSAKSNCDPLITELTLVRIK